MILLSDCFESAPALEVAPVAGVPLIILEEIVDILELEEIQPETEVQVLSRKTLVLEEGARPPTGRLASEEEVSLCHCLRKRSPSNQETLGGSRLSKRSLHR